MLNFWQASPRSKISPRTLGWSHFDQIFEAATVGMNCLNVFGPWHQAWCGSTLGPTVEVATRKVTLVPWSVISKAIVMESWFSETAQMYMLYWIHGLQKQLEKWIESEQKRLFNSQILHISMFQKEKSRYPIQWTKDFFTQSGHPLIIRGPYPFDSFWPIPVPNPQLFFALLLSRFSSHAMVGTNSSCAVICCSATAQPHGVRTTKLCL